MASSLRRAGLGGCAGCTCGGIYVYLSAHAPFRRTKEYSLSPRDQLGLCQDDDNKAACSLIKGENRNMIGYYQRVSYFS
jgi:hypothetical protein